MALDGVPGVRRTLLGEQITLQMDTDEPLDEAAVRAVLSDAGVTVDAVRRGTPSVF